MPPSEEDATAIPVVLNIVTGSRIDLALTIVTPLSPSQDPVRREEIGTVQTIAIALCRARGWSVVVKTDITSSPTPTAIGTDPGPELTIDTALSLVHRDQYRARPETMEPPRPPRSFGSRSREQSCSDVRYRSESSSPKRRSPSKSMESTGRNQHRPEPSIQKDAGKNSQNKPVEKVVTPKKVHNVSGMEAEFVLPHRPVSGRSEGRLTPWRDVPSFSSRKRSRQEVSCQGLPRDDEPKHPKKRQRDHGGPRNNNKVTPATKTLPESSEGKHYTEGANSGSPLVLKVDILDRERVILQADAFLAGLEQELMDRHPTETAAMDTTEEYADSGSFATAVSPAVLDGQLHSPEMPANPDRDGDISMSETAQSYDFRGEAVQCHGPEASAFPPDTLVTNPLSDHAGLGVDKFPPKALISMEMARPMPITALKTVKALQRDPPYADSVLDLWRGREHENVYVNVVKRKTALEMYEESGEVSIPQESNSPIRSAYRNTTLQKRN
ncbi:hypothetical protein Cob_v000796 [Colletotrichum orbiculare MAFF 240422]|uniref:Uncharacterized protein n=1 Tax=Colletotrichum orbiculare (strain 104-T / ATCC 96160 / CBS 514.97 / LARS 414 / MAFF 240422) TaxID=1213857 RepID=A0A484G5E7_COLOR|nr:hypothetical protein Cob_v000796 [Colletotrichum orbiculare MAFF 240422]